MNRLFLSILLLGMICFAQDGTPDLSFGDEGVLILPLTENPLEEGVCHLHGVAENSYGNIISLATHVDINTSYLVSVLEDGTLDTSFGTDGYFTLPMSEEFPLDALHINQADKFLIAYQDGSINKLMRLNPNGSIDTSFGIDGTLSFINSSSFYQVRYLDDSIFYQGNAYIDGIFHLVIERYTSDGELDTSYGTDGIFEMPMNGSSSIITDIEIIADGALLFGHSQSSGGEYTHYVSKVTPSGDLDSTYGINGTTSAIPVAEEYYLHQLLAYPDGSVLDSFQFWDGLAQEYAYLTVKLTPQGDLDSSFGTQGYLSGEIGSLLQPNGRIITNTPSYDWEGGYYPAFQRFFINGYSDSSFTYLPNVFSAFGVSYEKLLNSGKFLVASDRAWYNPYTWIILQKFNNDPLEISDFQLQPIRVYPNPSEGIFQLEFDTFNTNMPYSIFDITGKLVHTGTISNRNQSLDLSMFESGMYFLHLEQTIIKLIKN